MYYSYKRLVFTIYCRPETQNELCDLLDKNFDTRRKILGDDVVGRENIQIATIARENQLACKFTGSGGAFICIPRAQSNINEMDVKQRFCTVNATLCKIQPAKTTYPFVFGQE